MLLNGCAGIRVKVATDCSWAEPIEPSENVLNWLEDQDWPVGMGVFLNRVADHDELYDRWCVG